MKNNLFFAAGLALLASCSQPTNTTTTAERTLRVWGNCEHCKANIETAGQLEGVDALNWNTESKLLQVRLDTAKVQVNAVLKAIAGAGYDNELFRGDSSSYAALPECCQYERKP